MTVLGPYNYLGQLNRATRMLPRPEDEKGREDNREVQAPVTLSSMVIRF